MAFLASKLAAAVSFAMAEPGRLMGHTASAADMDDVDADGDYEMDDDYEQQPAPEATQILHPDAHSTDAEGSDVDAEGEDMDAEGEEVDDEDEAEPVGAVKIALRRNARSDEEDYDVEDEDEGVAHSSDAKTSDSDESSAESEEEAPWQAGSDKEEEAELAKSNPNVCVYCNQDEEHDPSEDFEPYLSCAVCGDNGKCALRLAFPSIIESADMRCVPAAHAQCARDANTLSHDDGTLSPSDPVNSVLG